MYDSDQIPDPHTPPRQHSGMETASIILGILGLVGSVFFYFAIPMSAIGILLAVLSKGSQKHMSGHAKAGLYLSVGSLILSISLTCYTLYQYRDFISSPEFREKMRDYLEYYYPSGEPEDTDDFLEEFFNDRSGRSSGENIPYENASPHTDVPYGSTFPYDDISPYTDSPYGSYWDTSPYDSVPSGNGSAIPGPEI